MAITLVTASHEAFGVILKAGFKCICMKQKAEMVSQRGVEGTGAAGRKNMQCTLYLQSTYSEHQF